MPLGNLKAIARLHLSGRAPPLELLTAAKAATKAEDRKGRKEKGKISPRRNDALPSR